MPGIEEKIAMEAIKPASGFINALLAPKIEKLKSWSNEKELSGQLDPDKLSKVMEEYLTKLSLRVSEITSIAFPLIKLDIFKAYEPLVLGRQHYSNSPIENEVELAKLIDEELKSSLIIDNAGMGKSTFSKFIVASLLYKSKRVPLFFELRKINKEIDLVENLAKELDFPGRVFDRALFYKLLQLGKFYVIIDGFDEVALDHQETLSNQINELSLKGGDNIILLTSRPQDTLPDIVKSDALRFKPFSQAQAISLLKRYDDISGLTIGEELTQQIGSVPQKFIESPLLVSLLYRTFGVNKSIAEKTCTFYEEIYHALYKGHDLINKNGYGREKKSDLDFEDFRKLLRAMCYFMMLNRKTSFESWSEATKFVDKASSISSITPSSASNFIDDLLVSVPLMHREGPEIKFFHKTLLEYFSAEYILFHQSSSKVLSKLFNSILAPSFNKTFEFLFELNSSLFDGVITYHFAKLAEEVICNGDILEQALHSLTFNKRCKIGLWRHSEHSLKLDGHDELLFDNSDSDILDEGYNTSTWNEGLLNGERYFIVLAFTDVSINYHSCAWKSISKPTTVESHDRCEASSEEMNILFQSLGENRWNELDCALIDKIKGIASISNIIINSIPSDRFNDSSEVRLLSKVKIEAILDKVRKEEEFTEETEQFL